MSRERQRNYVPLHIAVHIMRGQMYGATVAHPSVVAVREWCAQDSQRIRLMRGQVRASAQYLADKEGERTLGLAVLELKRAIDRGSPEQIGRAYRQVARLADPEAVLSL